MKRPSWASPWPISHCRGTGARRNYADHGAGTLVVEFDRRLSGQWSLGLETVAIFNVGEADAAYGTRRDSFMALNLYGADDPSSPARSLGLGLPNLSMWKGSRQGILNSPLRGLRLAH